MKSRVGLVFATLSAVLILSACGKSERQVSGAVASNQNVPRVEPEFRLAPSALSRVASGVPGEDALKEVVRVGSRVLDWVDLLQKEVPVEAREQIWRRIDRIGHEATPDAPWVTNPDTIQKLYQDSLKALPQSIQKIVTGYESYPNGLPAGIKLSEIMPLFRQINTAYSRASRWLVLYNYRQSMSQADRDLRPFLAVQSQREALIAQTQNWDKISFAQRGEWIKLLSQVCPMLGASFKSCKSAHSKLNDPDQGAQAKLWLDSILQRGWEHYQEQFGVQSAHEGVDVQKVGDELHLGFNLYQVPDAIRDWIGTQVSQGWDVAGTLKLEMRDISKLVPGAIQVLFQLGALPHVNGIGGDEITMDQNTPLWMEVSQVTMAHEFGHVIGFPDCYVEFWDDSKSSFVFYSLNPEDRMCALSGHQVDAHRDAILQAFGKVAR